MRRGCVHQIVWRRRRRRHPHRHRHGSADARRPSLRWVLDAVPTGWGPPGRRRRRHHLDAGVPAGDSKPRQSRLTSQVSMHAPPNDPLFVTYDHTWHCVCVQIWKKSRCRLWIRRRQATWWRLQCRRRRVCQSKRTGRRRLRARRGFEPPPGHLKDDVFAARSSREHRRRHLRLFLPLLDRGRVKPIYLFLTIMLICFLIKLESCICYRCGCNPACMVGISYGLRESCCNRYIDTSLRFGV